MTFQRTLRIPDDDNTYPLPPTLGRFPVHQVSDYARRVPSAWKDHGGVFIPMYQREALWLAFDGADWRPNAVQVGVGNINAVSGEPWAEHLSDAPQNYIICPEQMWLDGFNNGDGTVQQFIAMPLGRGYTVEAQLTGKEDVGGIQIRVYDPKAGRFPSRPPARSTEFLSADTPSGPMSASKQATMGMAPGGKMHQKIYLDKYGLDTWDQENFGSVFIHIVNSEQYRKLTRREPPPSPVNARTYTQHNFPWFEVYDEDRETLRSRGKLSEVKSVHQIDVSTGRAKSEDEEALEIDPAQIEKIKPPTSGQ